MPVINLHNHTIFSDGELSPKELVERAIEHDVDTLAITDHFEYFFSWRMEPKDIRLYIKVFNHMKEKYKDKIKLLTGLEIDLRFTELEEFPWEYKHQFDIILIERVYNQKDLEKLLEFRKRLPCKVGLAHPSFDGFTDLKELISILEKNDIFIELNTSCHDYKWPSPKPVEECPLLFENQEDFFRILKESKVELSMGTDHHSGSKRLDDLQRATDFIKKMDLEKNLINL